MSQAAELILIGSGGEGYSTEHLLSRIESIKKWDNGHDYEIQVVALDHGWYDKIENVRTAIEGDLQEYIQNNMKLSNRMTFKSGGQCELMIVDNPDYINAEVGSGRGSFRKHRNQMKHLTPAKKEAEKKLSIAINHNTLNRNYYG